MKYCNVQQAEAFFFEEHSLLSAFVDSYLLSLSSNRNFTVITDFFLIFAFSDLENWVLGILEKSQFLCPAFDVRTD
mgnify:CR=1 FL=1